MNDEDLRKIDEEQLQAEKEVLEGLLKDYPWSGQRRFWLEELERINNTLKGVFFKTDS